ncbi:oligosaccharide flippase family protein [Microcella sp.]|uniref:oligosaccharide flippase family protein n=1 Tax=Microcella sp. TaxID=1913979 RepID=UPI00299F8456|nr:oligosaccharide flippase family protein [Microcella sp.]MDX2026904.1 oligosaccharide flippase family protein [Microcella sp.]
MTSPTPRRLGARTVLTGTALLSTTMLAVSAANYGLNFVLARLLDPAEFGDASLAITLVLAAAVIAATLQLVASKSVAADPASLEAVRRTLVRAALAAGAVAVLVLGGGAWLIADALSVSSPWMLVIVSLGLPIYFVQAVHRGALQGQLRFARLALSYGVEASVRVIVVLVLVVAGLGVIGASVGILLSFVASAAIARARGGDRSPRPQGVAWSVVRDAVVAAIVLLVGQTLLNNADLFIAKAVLDAPTAGVYAAAAVLGRSVFFVSWSVVHVVFPVIASVSSTPSQRRRAFATAVAIIAGVGGVGVGVALLARDGLMSVVFGDDYAAAGSLLVPYLVATSFFALANLFAAADLARGYRAGPVVLAIGAVVQTVALALWARTPEALVWGQVAGTAAIVIGLATLVTVRWVRARRVRILDMTL